MTSRAVAEPCFVKFVVALFHFTLTLMGSVCWLSFTPASYQSSVYFNCSLLEINLLSVLFLASTIVCGPPSIWFLERFGLARSLTLASWTMTLGSGLRLLSGSDMLGEGRGRFALLTTGQSLMAAVLPLSIFSPPTTVALYFSSEWRTIANTVITLATLLGVIVTGTLSPTLVSSGNMKTLLAFPFVICCVNSVIGSFFLFLYDKQPATNSATKRPDGGKFLADVWSIVSDRNSLVLVFVVGGGVGLLSAIAILIEQMLCPIGYDNILAGYASSALTVSGIVGALVMGVVCDRIKQPSTIIKISFVWVTAGYIIFLSLWETYLGKYIIGVFVAFGFLAIGIFPIGVELAIECSHPASPSTVSGLIQLVGNLQGIILSILIPYFGRPMSKEDAEARGSVCFHRDEDYGSDLVAPACALGGYVTIMCLILVLFFRPVYRRRQDEIKLLTTTCAPNPSPPDEQDVTSPALPRDELDDDDDVITLASCTGSVAESL